MIDDRWVWENEEMKMIDGDRRCKEINWIEIYLIT
jgi:hypothetical protein